jgi:hypothetical protein
MLLKDKLEKETADILKILCRDYKITPEQLVDAFLRDLTATPGSGSDERMMADQWFERHLTGDEFIY